MVKRKIPNMVKTWALALLLCLLPTLSFAQPSLPPFQMQYNAGTGTVAFFGNVTTPLSGSCSGNTCTITIASGALSNTYVDYTGTTGMSLAANTCYWGALGIICEGSTANSFETYLQFTNPTGNNVITFPNETGNVCTTGSVCTGYQGTNTQIGTGQNSSIHGNDNIKRYYGTDSDWWRMYDETNNDQLFDGTSKTGAGSTSVPMYALLVDNTHSNGSSLTANQQVWGICKGTETTNQCVVLVDAEGDIVFTKANAHTIKVEDSTSGDGSALTISAGTSTTSNTNGGALNLNGGTGVSLGAGGAVNITSGAGLVGGAITIANGAGLGADITIQASSGIINLYNGTANVIAPTRSSGGIAGKSLTLRSGGGTSATNNLAAGEAVLGTGASTGTGDAILRLQTRARATATASTDNAVQDRYVASGAKAVTDNSATSIVDINIASNTMAGGALIVTCLSTDATNYQAVTAQVNFAGVNKAGTMSCTAATTGTNQNATSTGTPTLAASATTGTNKCVIQVTCDQTYASPSTGYPRVSYQVLFNTDAGNTITPL